MKQKRGKRPLSLTAQQALVHKIEPYLKAGLSIRTACLESGVPRSTLYKLMDENEEIMDQIRRFQNYLNVLTVSSVARHLFGIGTKQQRGSALSEEDVKFLQWFATHSKHCKEEFGKETIKSPVLDAQVELMKMMRMIDNFCDQAI